MGREAEVVILCPPIEGLLRIDRGLLGDIGRWAWDGPAMVDEASGLFAFNVEDSEIDVEDELEESAYQDCNSEGPSGDA
jgi:hypothetical protein